MSVLALTGSAQSADSASETLDIQQCIRYAMKHQPVLLQSLIDENITDRTIRSNLAEAYPQVNLTYAGQHYMQRPSVTSPLTQKNISTGSVSLSQNIFNSNVLLASKTAGDLRLNAKQNIQLSEIDLVVSVSKAYYDVLVTRQQVVILEGDVLRLQRSLKDASLQYEAGTVDKTDYKRASIALNNALASKKQFEEQEKAKIAWLKQLMGFDEDRGLSLIYDPIKLEEEAQGEPASFSTYHARVEFQQLKTVRRIFEYNLRYTKWNYFPTISFIASYNLVSQSQKLGKLYDDIYPNSFVGLSLSVPVFQGTKRIQATRLARLQIDRLEQELRQLELQIKSEYISAQSAYISSTNNYQTAKENLALAREVYTTVQLQYRSGVKTYLDVVIAENDLRTAEVGSLDALLSVLVSKLDLQRAAGTIKY